jgi:hypothetical protein
VLAYCATHQTDTTGDAVQNLLLTVLKTAKNDK